MVKSEEFKPGNYIILSTDPSTRYQVIEVNKVNAVRIKSANGKENWYNAVDRDLLPAILNEEWFFYFGFTKDTYQERGEILEIHYVIMFEDGREFRIRKSDPHYSVVPNLYMKKWPKLKYVHTVQQLYEELTNGKMLHPKL